jgi:hypothetical protein
LINLGQVDLDLHTARNAPPTIQELGVGEATTARGWARDEMPAADAVAGRHLVRIQPKTGPETGSTK